MPKPLRSTCIIATLALTSGLARGAPAPDATAWVTRLVLLDAPTRWDAYVAANGGTSVGLAAAHERSATEAVQRAERRIGTLGAPVVDVVARTGGEVLGRYDTATAALLVRVPLSAVPALAGLPGIAAVQPAPRVEVDLVDSVPAIGARRVATELGVDGRGTVIAVADTGIDYTHAAFDGPGSEAAYAAAASSADRIDDTWQGQPFFPTDKVIAGWDFAGPLYAPECDALLERLGRCTIAPRPDADPLDTIGHGTHVAGIAAGLATGPVAAGVAPGAQVVALKIFGASRASELILEPLEWVMEANMGAPGRPRVDVLNLSLGQIYGGDVLVQSGAVRRAVDAGVVVVAAAGNDGNLPFVAGAPAVAPEALAVASHTPPGRHGFSATLESDRTPVASTFGESSMVHQPWSPDRRMPLTSPVVFVGRGCPDTGDQPEDRYLADPRGAVAMFVMALGSESSACTADRQVQRLQTAGALGALMATGQGVPTASAWDAAPTVDIPVWMVADDFEQAVRAGAAAGATMSLSVALVPHPDVAGVSNDFSSRGPTRAGALKPDLSAPGSGIVSAAMGQGRRGIAYSGTSMATPHVAGTAALVWAAARAAGSAIDARDVAARIVNTADPAVLRLAEGQVGPPPLARGGSGAVDAWAAVTTATEVRAGDLATLDFGVQVLSGPPVTVSREITVRNVSAVVQRYAVSATFRRPGDARGGLDLVADPEHFELPAGASRTMRVDARFVPTAFPPWHMRGGEAVGNGAALGDSELDGWLTLSSRAAATNDAGLVLVPFYALVRPAADIGATWRDNAWPRWAVFANAGLVNSSVELFNFAAADSVDFDLPATTDLDFVGVRALPVPADGTTRVEFLLHTRGVRTAPLATESVVELDTNLDGRVDYEVHTVDEELRRTGAFRNGQVVAALEEPTGGAFGRPIVRFAADVDIAARYTVLPFVLEDTGLTPSTMKFNYRFIQREAIREDRAFGPAEDHVPEANGWLTLDGSRQPYVPARWQADVRAGGEASIGIAAGPGYVDAPVPQLLALLPDDVPGPGDLVVLPPTRLPTPPVFLPVAVLRH